MRKNILFIIILFFLQPIPIFSQLIPAEYTIKNIKVNTKYSDFGASYFGPNRILFASSKLDGKKLRNKFNANKDDEHHYDLFKGYLNYNGEINYTKKILNKFVTKYNESNVSFTPDLKYVYFTQNNIKKGKYVQDNQHWINLKIYRAKVNTNGEWTHVVSLPFNSDSYSCAHPTVSEDGKILFFASDMPGTYGKSDIYWVTILKNGKYGTPQNIGTHVNSNDRENFPYVDGTFLYFSSDRKESMGGLDVFMVALDKPDSRPVNLGATINSTYDDFCFVIDRKNKKGFFSSNRPSGKGKDDIFFFTQDTDIQECKQVIKGEIRDKKTDKVVPGAIISMYSHDNILLSTYTIKSDGKYKFDLACRDNYRVQATKIGYNKTFKHIGFTPKVFTQNIILYIEKKVVTKPIVKKTPKDIKTKDVIKKPIIPDSVVEKKPVLNKNGKEILNLKPIYFELDEYYITQESYETLAKAVRILKDYPNIVIEFGSHTDCRSSDSYNLHLSTLRANEVVKHLVYLGVPEHRIKGRGYGESKLINKCRNGVKCTEEEHLKNRRTEFLIIKK